MTCLYCDEPILPGETYAIERLPNLQDIHRECVVRMVMIEAEDPPGVTAREGAKLWYEQWMERSRDA